MKQAYEYLSFPLLSALFVVLFACAQPHGSLFIKADRANQGHYAIYRIAATKPLQLLAKQRGVYNRRLSLPASDYLILADCSHVMVQIKAGQLTELQARHLEFVPPLHEEQSYFPLQCSQFKALNLRQHFRNKFNFSLLEPKVKLLVATKQLEIDFKKQNYLRHDLSSLRVGTSTKQGDYFIYPHGNLLAVTERQKTGQWISLLAGDYVVEFNGTRVTVALQAKEQLTLPTVSLTIAANHAGASDVALFNAGQTIYYNQPFITLPTTLSLSLHANSSPLTLKLADATTIAARSVALIPPCLSGTACQEQHLQFFLYEKGRKIPFVRAKIGERVFFARTNVSVAIEGSQGITYQLPNTNRDMIFKLGKLKLNYLKHKNSKRYTDLLRLEANDRNMQGHSIDLRFGGNHGTLLIAGKYKVAHYVSAVNAISASGTGNKSASGEDRTPSKQNVRRRYLAPLRIVAGKTTTHSQKIIARN